MNRRQCTLLAFLRDRAVAGEPVPSFEEMAAHVGLLSKSTVGFHLDRLELLGFITRHRSRNRAITVVGIDEFARGYRAGFADGIAQRSAA